MRTIIPEAVFRVLATTTISSQSSISFPSLLSPPRSKKWFPQNTTDVDTRWVSLKLENYRTNELEISDAHHVPQPIIIPHKNDLDRLDSPVDVVFYELGREGNFERFTANKRKILYPERELFFSLSWRI